MYKHTLDSNNLRSLDCVNATLALQQQLPFLCTLLCQNLFDLTVLPPLQFMWERRANCVSCPNDTLLYRNHPDTVESWDGVSASYFCLVFYGFFHLSIMVCGYSLYLCHFAVHVSWFDVQTWFLTTRWVPTEPYLRWSSELALQVTDFSLLQVSALLWTFMAVISSTVENTSCLSIIQTEWINPLILWLKDSVWIVSVQANELKACV